MVIAWPEPPCRPLGPAGGRTREAIHSEVMKTATVSEITRNLGAVLDWVKAGEEVEVLEGEKPVALISPPRSRMQHPDYAARLRRTFGEKTLTAADSQEIRDLNRGDR